MNTDRTVSTVISSPPVHWVGDGFPVTSVFSTHSIGHVLSPYLLFDYAGPQTFKPSDKPRGVDTHPHRGFETVTLVYQGELEHRDSAGNSGSIGPGDVQWMTAAAGILHEEKHSETFSRQGGVLEMAQFWVNLPAAHKNDPPRYQTLLAHDIPTVQLPDDAGQARIIASAFGNVSGAAKTATAVMLWDVTLRAGARVHLPVPDGFNGAVFVRRGTVRIGQTHTASVRQLAVLNREGGRIEIEADENAELVVLGGESIDEPVIAHGPFVMNTQEEIKQAFGDFREGRFGEL